MDFEIKSDFATDFCDVYFFINAQIALSIKNIWLVVVVLGKDGGMRAKQNPIFFLWKVTFSGPLQ